MIGALSRSQILRCVAAIASFILTGCAASETEDAGVLRIGMMPKLVGIDYFNANEKGAREAAAELGVELVWDGPITADVTCQAQMLDSWIAQRLDAICRIPKRPPCSGTNPASGTRAWHPGAHLGFRLRC